MAITLYVGNLPWRLTEDELAEAFSTCSKVENVRIITDRETGRSRGFGFVEIPESDVSQAMELMNGFELKGRKLIVNQARPRASEL
jgi:RNA recognition motif-containing protein